MVNKLNNNLEYFLEPIAILGECPLWDSDKKLLYWIDIVGKKIFCMNTKNNIFSTYSLNVVVGSIALRKNGELIVASDKGIFFFNQNLFSFNNVCNPENSIITNRFNDGKCDGLGRFWAGTTSIDERGKRGSLYCITKDLKCRKVLGNIIVSNGIAWSKDNSIMYYIDSPTKKVRAYDYNINNGSIKNERIVISFSDSEGYPDGMAIDIEDKLWIAHWGGYKVGRWDPISGKMIGKVDIPVQRVSSLTFGGENLNELFITTAKKGFSEKFNNKRDSYSKYDGMLFNIKTDIRGIEAARFGI